MTEKPFVRPTKRQNQKENEKERSKPLLVFVDDEYDNIEAFTLNFDEYFHVEGFISTQKALDFLTMNTDTAIIISDLKMPEESGVEFLEKARAVVPEARRLILTAYADVNFVIESLHRAGIHRYMLKPWNRDEIMHQLEEQHHIYEIEKQLQENYQQLEEKNIALGNIKRRLEKENEALLSYNSRLSGVEQEISNRIILGNYVLLYRSPAMEKVVHLIQKMKVSTSPVLIRGEPGCGKELIARFIHETSPVHNGPLISGGIAGLSEEMMEQDLFGMEDKAGNIIHRGKLERAAGGTLYIKGIVELTSDLQAKLLRFLEDGRLIRRDGNRFIESKVRIIISAGSDLEGSVENGKFRGDLFYRLSSHIIEVPPLRERREDIPYLASHFLEKQQFEGDFSREAMQLMLRYDWPGNVREIENRIMSATLKAESKIEPTDLGITDLRPLDAEIEKSLDNLLPDSYTVDPAFHSLIQSTMTGNPIEMIEAVLEKQGKMNLDRALEEYERAIISAALKKTGGNKARAAEILGVKAGKFLYRSKQLGL